MKEFADNINYNLELDPDAIKKRLESGLIGNDPEKGEVYRIKPIFIANDPIYSPIPPWDHSKFFHVVLYISYDLEPAKERETWWKAKV